MLKRDFNDIIRRKPLANVMYITFTMIDFCMKCVWLTETFGFLCPSRISSAITHKDAKRIQKEREERYMYIEDALRDDKASDGKVYLAPFNIG